MLKELIILIILAAFLGSVVGSFIAALIKK